MNYHLLKCFSSCFQAEETTKSKLKKTEKLTKVKDAKKALKKKFKVNTKIVFADDGEVSVCCKELLCLFHGFIAGGAQDMVTLSSRWQQDQLKFIPASKATC